MSIKTVFNLLKDSDKSKLKYAIADKICYCSWFRSVSDRLFLKLIFSLKTGYRLNLRTPRTFNEKLQWLKLNDRKKIYSTMVDKCEVKDYVAERIGSQYIIPTLGVYNSLEEIKFETLPKQFVMKCTHDSGSVIVCSDKSQLDIANVKHVINRGLKNDLYYFGREWPYKDLERRIIVEKYLVDDSLGELRDYKFFCFDGTVQFYKVDFDRFISHKANYYDINGNLMPFGEVVCPPDYEKKIEKPHCLKKMIELAQELSKGIPFLRVDFYEVNKQIYFGEMTFFPASGFGPFTEKEWDYKLGKLIKLDSNH